MGHQYRLDYNAYSDKQIVEMILAEPHNEEAAAFLIYNRYDPLLRSIFNSLTQDYKWFDDCVEELFIHLKGTNRDWHALATFEWRSTLGHWLTDVARNKFMAALRKLIDNGGRNVSVDNDNPEKPKVQLPDDGVETYERRQRKVLLMEAIGQLQDDDQRFVLLKRLKGYDSKEIALMLQMKWKRQGIVKYNNRHEMVVPDADYVNVRMQRAKEKLNTILIKLYY